MQDEAILSKYFIKALASSIVDELEPKFSQIEKSIKDLKPKPEAEFLSRKEVCEKLKITEPTLWRLQKSGKIPFVKIGRRILFEKQAVLNSIGNNFN